MIGGEVAVRDSEIPLQVDGIARGERDHGLQPDRGGERDTGGAELAIGTLDFRCAVQHKSPTNAGRGAGIDLVEEHCAKDVDAIDRGDGVIVPRVERTMIVMVGVGEAKLRPGPDADVVVVVGEGLEAW